MNTIALTNEEPKKELSFLELNSIARTVGEDGFYQLDKDLEAVQKYLEYIEKRMVPFKSRRNRFQWLIDNNYYYSNVLEQYTMEQLLELDEFVYSVPFEWKSFMAVSKFYKSYALKTNKKKKILETYQDRIVIEALYLAKGVFEDAKDYTYEMIIQNYQPATPTFMNGGRARRGEMISCFLTEIDDSLNAITFNWRMTADLSKKGGGVANNISKMRARGESIMEVEGAASGVIPNMKVHEDISSYINQLGQRDGAFADYLNINHPDFIDFLDVKKINADEKVKMTRLSLGAIVPSIFFDKAFADEDWYFFYPLSVRQAYGIHMDDMDMDEMYETLLADERVKKEKSPLTARQLLNKIATMQIESGYPYMFYKTNANRNHPLKRLGQVKFSNLCTEIMQLSEVSNYTDYNEEDEIKYDIQCCLGSLNIVNVMDSGRIKEAVHVATKMLTAVLDLTDIPNAPAIMKANRELHAIGIGYMNLMGYLMKNNIPYEHKDAREFADKFGFLVNYYSLEASMEMAKKRGTFKGFEQSDYADGTYFEEIGYLVDDYRVFEADRVEKLFEGIYIPSPEDCRRLMEDIMKYGLYHAYRQAIAPTQSIAYVQNSTSSIMPNTQIIETRTYGETQTYYPMPYLSRQNYTLYWKTAYNMNQKRIIDMVATFQKHVDQGISCILFVPDDIPTEQLAHYMVYANHVGLKSLYYVRTKNTTASECEACAV
jgi:ribonucleoside-diphosphate reductase alpha chain